MYQLSPRAKTHLHQDFHQWLPMLGIAVVVKAGVETAFALATRDLPGAQYEAYYLLLARIEAALASVVLSIFLALYIVRTLRRHPRPTPRAAFHTGMTWIAYTCLFEFGLGMATDTVLDLFLPGLFFSSTWLLVPLTLSLAPVLVARVHRPAVFAAVKRTAKRKRA